MDKKGLTLVVVAALGYFVDIYDLILFGIVRVSSLQDLNLSPEEIKNSGALLMNLQMLGMLVGGIVFGILGDTKGRVKVLFGSILLYSLANIANGFVNDTLSYAIIRFIAGIGLAGELGAGITLVSETMDKEKRGYGTMIIVVVGALGAVVAALVGEYFHWRTAYFVGGGLGLLLLALRMGTFESGMFKDIQHAEVKKGAFFSLFTNKKVFKKYLACILTGLPVWYVIGILIVFSPEISKEFNLNFELKSSAKPIMWAYIGLSFGDLLSGLLSQIFRNRIKVVAIFILFSLIMSAVFLYVPAPDENIFYLFCFLLGTGTGFWALFVTIASEQFGTNIRSTVTTTVPNFVRGSLNILTLAFLTLEANYGLINSAMIVGVISCSIALVSVLSLKESFGKDLNYIEDLDSTN